VPPFLDRSSIEGGSGRAGKEVSMPTVEASFGWQEAATMLTIIVVTAFLVTWIVTDVLHVSRTPYVAILSAVVAGLSALYLGWSGASLADLLTKHWAWAVVAGLAAAGVVGLMLRRVPSPPRAERRISGGQFVWEGVVYGTAEALLLATLPVLAAWGIVDDLGWTDGTVGTAAAGAVAILASLVVITVHHLGYREFRGRASRRILAMTIASCGLQALAFLVTGNVLAPIVAHIILHWQLIIRGLEMPPSRHPIDLRLVVPSGDDQPAGDVGGTSSSPSSKRPSGSRPVLPMD
jgi:hypothetical protein